MSHSKLSLMKLILLSDSDIVTPEHRRIAKNALARTLRYLHAPKTRKKDGRR